MKTSDMTRIVGEIQSADDNTLVVFDVDDVLIQPQDQILQSPYNPSCQGYEKIVDLRFTEAEAYNLYSLVWLQRKVEPVHNGFIDLISQLQEKGTKVLALTNCVSGKFGHIISVEDWRIQELKSLGYHFDQSWNESHEKVFDQLITNDPEKFPVFKKGVIFTNGVVKGEVLKAFLNDASIIPQRLIFIDDLATNLQSVEAAADEFGIPFTGIEYTAVKESITEPLNKHRAKLQFEILAKERKWLSDQEIDAYDHNLRAVG